MNLANIIKRIRTGELTEQAGLDAIEKLQQEHASEQYHAEQLHAGHGVSDVMVDHDRKRRCGAAEVIYAAGKTADQVVRIAKAIYVRGDVVLMTRANDEQITAVCDAFKGEPIEVADSCGAVMIGSPGGMEDAEDSNRGGMVVPIVTAGTSDLPVAEEAAMTVKAMGCEARMVCDVGVAGLHRLMGRMDELGGDDVRVLIVVAGMEGALPSVVGGLVDVPVIAVPTSVGYGASFGGVAALLGMLNSCASGVVVVNIDNGFGAGYTASMIVKQNRVSAND
ncbi:AIR carboxylase [Poriferisphaera corsica]|uniref:AIR carboxylase n=1 Tax=Poriferisphaera corsica TaxID=2528020 RepID=A0A517YRD9_9BACT|nr:nickel pincer cofactor biosynthesis protein LarB [Poriferisphaera corsica]QDU32784.1 AIR carboxylase [Poriferisphaera corsica]